ncbi:MAG: 3-deoxy-D-manno-octulosonic acid transferase [Bacteroidetes bacterium]|nr:3-deoxy-D-manno-octulosonic acid transferase [Bacteroidota bacterium]
MRFFYNLFIYLYQGAVKTAAVLGNEKAKKWVKGRKNVFIDIKNAIGKDDRIIWVHCASLGEFEQGRPLIETIRKRYKNYKILLTFFSPSGYEIRKNYAQADYVFYLPMDTQRNARKFIRLVQPRAVFFIKYEFWFNYINELYIRTIPLFMVSSIFRPSQHFFRFWGAWFKRQLRKVTFLFVQDEQSLELLESIKIYHADMIGDTRFDRVLALTEEKQEFPTIESFKAGKSLLIAGSTWPADEDKLRVLIDKLSVDFKIVIAPHQVDKEHIDQLTKKFIKFKPMLYSSASDGDMKNSRVLIIDGIGYLSYLYTYADITYIGGGFGAGIHNLLEAATYGKPVIFGPNHDKFKEAIDLKRNGGGFVVSGADDLIRTYKLLFSDQQKRTTSGNAAKNYVLKNAGATEKVMDKANEFLMV